MMGGLSIHFQRTSDRQIISSPGAHRYYVLRRRIRKCMVPNFRTVHVKVDESPIIFARGNGKSKHDHRMNQSISVIEWIKICPTRTKENNTRDSNVVPHRSTNRARACLTSLSRREAVLSCWYGRSHLYHNF